METPVSNLPKRRFRISLRALILLVVIMGVWMGYRVNRARKQREVVAAVKINRGHVTYDWELANGRLGGRPPAPGWLLKRFGAEYFQEVAQVMVLRSPHPARPGASTVYNVDRLLPLLSTQTNLVTLRLTATGLTDRGWHTFGNSPG